MWDFNTTNMRAEALNTTFSRWNVIEQSCVLWFHNITKPKQRKTKGKVFIFARTFAHLYIELLRLIDEIALFSLLALQPMESNYKRILYWTRTRRNETKIGMFLLFFFLIEQFQGDYLHLCRQSAEWKRRISQIALHFSEGMRRHY